MRGLLLGLIRYSYFSVTPIVLELVCRRIYLGLFDADMVLLCLNFFRIWIIIIMTDIP